MCEVNLKPRIRPVKVVWVINENGEMCEKLSKCKGTAESGNHMYAC